MIYFASPQRFNDPYDCALFPTVSKPSDAAVERIRQHYLAREQMDESVRRSFETMSTSGLRIMLLRIGQNVVEQAVTDFRAKRGVSCFAERPDNLLMWSHYSGHQSGFCLEFRTDSDPFTKMCQVQYSAEMPAFDLEPMLCDKDFDQVLSLFCTKSVDWQYEKEWRCLHNEAGTAYVYTDETLTGVYFGPQASPALFEIVALVLLGQNEKVKLWRGIRSKENFNVVFEEVTYTPYLEAVKRGLIRKSGA